MDNRIMKSSFDVLRGVLYAIIISVFLTLALALLIKFTGINAKAVMFIMQGIKIVSILIGIYLGIKDVSMGAAKGALSGFLYIMLSFLVFKMLASKIVSLTIFDVLLGTVVGLISGVLCVNIKGK